MEFRVNQDYDRCRLDIVLSKLSNDLSRSKIKSLILKGYVYLYEDNVKFKISDPNYLVNEGDHLILDESEIYDVPHATPKDISFDILYEDTHLLVINKPQGLVVHPGAGNSQDTLVSGLLYRYKDMLSSMSPERPGIVHRLDKDTSGVLVIAKNDKVHHLLAEQFAVHSIKRHYRALVWGLPTDSKKKIVTFLTRSRKDRKKMTVHNTKGKQAITTYKVLDTYRSILSLLKLTLYTGRTHQIRVHLSHIGHPIVGDKTYGSQHKHLYSRLDNSIQEQLGKLDGQCLHAYCLGFQHPVTKEDVLISCNESPNIQQLFSKLFVKYSDLGTV